MAEADEGVFYSLRQPIGQAAMLGADNKRVLG